MRKPRARIFAMYEPGVTWGGPAGRRLAVGSQAARADAAATDDPDDPDTAIRSARETIVGADPGTTTQTASAAAASASAGRPTRGRAITGTPRSAGSPRGRTRQP